MRLIESLAAGLIIGVAAGTLDTLFGFALHKTHFSGIATIEVYLFELAGFGIWTGFMLCCCLLIYLIASPFTFLTSRKPIPGVWAGLTGGILAGIAGFAILAPLLPVVALSRLIIGWSVLLIFASLSGVTCGFGIYALTRRISISGLAGLSLLSWLLLLSCLHILIFLARPPLDFSHKPALAISVVMAVALLVIGVWFVVLHAGSALRIVSYALILLFFWALPLSTLLYPHGSKVQGNLPERPLNVILIVADACRADSLSYHGQSNPTPNLDRLAEQGAVFTRAYSQSPWTIPSMMSMTASLDPDILRQGIGYSIPWSVETLAESLNKRGYQSKALVANSILGPETGIGQGFDEFVLRNAMIRLDRLSYLPSVLCWYSKALIWFNLKRFPDTSTEFTEQVLKYIEQPTRPYYMWVHYLDPHDPYDPPEEYLKTDYRGQLRRPFAPQDFFREHGNPAYPRLDQIRKGPVKLDRSDRAFVRELYDAEVRHIDDLVGKIADNLRSSGQDKSTLLIFTSDHGEEFWDHGDYFHGQSLFNEQLHVPLILWGAVPSIVVDEPVALLDLMPTIREMLGLAADSGAQGRSLMPLIDGDTVSARPVFAGETFAYENMSAVINEDWKLIYYMDSERFEFYDLAADPAELFNLYTADNPLARDFAELLGRRLDGNDKLRDKIWGTAVNRQADDAVNERLRALGYVR